MLTVPEKAGLILVLVVMSNVNYAVKMFIWRKHAEMLNSSRQSKVVQKSIYGFINHTAGLGIIELGKYLAAKSFINITISDCY